MLKQARFKFRRGDLHALVLDEFLDAVDDEKEAVLIGVADIAGVVPAVGIDRLGGIVGLLR